MSLLLHEERGRYAARLRLHFIGALAHSFQCSAAFTAAFRLHVHQHTFSCSARHCKSASWLRHVPATCVLVNVPMHSLSTICTRTYEFIKTFATFFLTWLELFTLLTTFPAMAASSTSRVRKVHLTKAEKEEGSWNCLIAPQSLSPWICFLDLDLGLECFSPVESLRSTANTSNQYNLN